MKNFYTKWIQIPICLVLGFSYSCYINAQTYKIGDLYTFDDGSVGVVFFVDPDNPCSGTVAALNDLDGQYALWTGSKPQALTEIFAPYGGLDLKTISGWESHGRRFTQAIWESGNSPAANAMDVSAGWYIPDAMQLFQLYASAVFLQDAFADFGGEILSIWAAPHWSSTQESKMTSRVYAFGNNQQLERSYATTAKYVRPVRDFPDAAEANAFWAVTLSQADTTVSPDSTTAYDALVVYRSDTLPLTATVTVYQPTTVTLYDTVYATLSPYIPSAVPSLGNIDISIPGSYEYKDTVQTVHGCDSVITLLLEVSNHVRYTDTLCSIKDDYYFAPFDTVFAVGTVSGVYEHHGSKLVDGVPIDTVAYYDLTVLPDYEVFDTVGWCLYESFETRLYEGSPHVSIVVNGSSVQVVSDSENIVVEEIMTDQDFALKMQTAHGCDSVVFLHVEARHVARDTVFQHVPITQLVGDAITVVNHTFTGITDPGIYTASDTLMAANGCDSVAVVSLTVDPCVSGFSIICPPDVYDTLPYGACAMKIEPIRLGTPTVQFDTDWPFLISNDIPADHLFAQGDNIVTWTATDPECGNSVSCEQHVKIAFRQCPDATDFEGNVYHGVRIGCDCWTQRNLESTKYSDGAEISGKYAYANILYPDTLANIAVFGRLYSFDAAVRDGAVNGFGHVQGICPEGWYLPTPDKYEGLNAYGTAALKSPLYWIDGGGNNSTGFSSLPAGYYNGAIDRYEGLLTEAYYWSTQLVSGQVKDIPFTVSYVCDLVSQSNIRSGLAYSVRCIKEE